MKEPLKVGQRVKICGYTYGGTNADGITGKVLEGADADGDVLVETAFGELYAKESQLVRLRPKPRREWVGVWMPAKEACSIASAANVFVPETWKDLSGPMTVREVRRKK